MKHLFQLLIIGALIIGSNMDSKAQDSTIIYFDKYWNQVTSVDNYTYYRIEKRIKRYIDVTNYYKDGTLRMKGTRSPIHDEDYWEQELTFYSDSGGISHYYNYVNNKKNGKSYSYYSNGQIKGITTYLLGKKIDVDSFFFKDGKILSTTPYVNDERNGKSLEWFNNGNLHKEEMYVDDILEGTQLYYFEEGPLRRKEVYEDSVRTMGICYDAAGNEIPFFERVELPKFTESFNKFLAHNLRYPDEASANEQQGKVIVHFEVSKTGKVQNVHVKQAFYASLAEEAIRVIKLSNGKWSPGKIEGEEKDMLFKQPITFRLD